MLKSELAARPIKVLGVSLAIGIALGAVGGAILAVTTSKAIIYGMATAWLVIGIVALALGLMGALEPAEGWATGIGRGRGWETSEAGTRRSLLGRAASEAVEGEVSSWALALWSFVVGGGLIVLAMVTFSLIYEG